MDIGCGFGAGVLAAASLGFSETIGVDRDRNEFWHTFSWDDIPQMCSEYGIPAEKVQLVEGDFFAMPWETGSFDCCLMLDVIEHVPHPEKFIKRTYDLLSPGGFLLLDTCPLYYGINGAHLWEFFAPSEYPWIHLWRDFPRMLKERVTPEFHWSRQRFFELNRTTHDDIRNAFLGCGFEIVQEVRQTSTPETAQLLEQFRDRFDPAHLKNESLLFEEWILLVGRKPPVACLGG